MSTLLSLFFSNISNYNYYQNNWNFCTFEIIEVSQIKFCPFIDLVHFSILMKNRLKLFIFPLAKSKETYLKINLSCSLRSLYQSYFMNVSEIGGALRFKHIVLFALTILLISSCKGYKLDSEWRDREIKIDGDDREWDESRFHIDNEGIVASVMNDEEFLYLCIYTKEKSLSQKILRQGLTLWLNSKAKQDKDLGIRYPLPKHPAEVREDLKKDIIFLGG